MASLRRLPGSRFFIGCFTDHTGRRIQRSTKTTDRRLAHKIVSEWESVTRVHATSAQFQRVLSAMHTTLHGAPLAAPTLRDYAAKWFDHKARTTREVSLRNYKVAVNNFVEAMGTAADKPIHFITTGAITAWQNASADRASNRTALNKLKIVRTLFQSAWRDGLLPDGNPASKVEALKKEESTRRPFTLPELKRVLRACGDGPWRGMVLLGLYTGQRLKDLASLTWRAVDMEENEVNFITSKTGRAQSIPIASPLRAYLETLDAGDDPDQPLFPTLHPLAVRAGGTSALSQAFHGILCD
ncbi:MAG: tyrosine-type recombinase/integrase, partial [Verrucomicrobiota bacterium]